MTKQRDATSICRSKLIERIGLERFELWFQSEQAIQVDGNCLIVSNESEFNLTCIRKSFGKTIATIARRQLGSDAQVVYREYGAKVEKDSQSQIVLSDSDCINRCGPGNHCGPETKFDSSLQQVDPNSLHQNLGDDIPAQTSCNRQQLQTEEVQFGENRASKHGTTDANDNSRSITTAHSIRTKSSIRAENPGISQKQSQKLLPEFQNLPEPQEKNNASQHRLIRTQDSQKSCYNEATKTSPKRVFRQQAINFASPHDGEVIFASTKNGGDAKNEKSRRGLVRDWARLETFVVDDRNKVAACCATDVLNQIGEITPLFLSGPTGSGKTHLMEGIYRGARGRVRPGRALYISAAKFTNDFLEALREHKTPIFRQRFYELDILLIDDVQFFQGKRSTINELNQLIDYLLPKNKQLVLCADRAPNELGFLGKEFATRISSGLVCRLDYPSIEGRREIVCQAARERDLSLPPSVIELISERITSDLRHVRGAINRLHAFQLATSDPITFENALAWLTDIFQTAAKPPTIAEIEGVVCQMFGIDEKKIRSSDKSRRASQPRMLAMWLARKYTAAGLEEIGSHFGGRKHSTVVSARNTVTGWIRKGRSIPTVSGEMDVSEAVKRLEAKLHVG